MVTTNVSTPSNKSRRKKVNKSIINSSSTRFPYVERVVIFTAAYYVVDGVSLTVRKLRTHLKSHGIESRVVSCAPPGWFEEDVFIVPSIPLPVVNAEDFGEGHGYSMGTKLSEECKKQILDFNPSILHFTVPDLLALDALRWGRSQGLPIMGTWHSNYADYLQFYGIGFIRWFVDKYLLSFYSTMPTFVPTPFIKQKLVKHGFPEQQVGLWGRGVDLDLFNSSNRSIAFRHSKGIRDDDVLILWVGRVVKEKSPDVWMGVIRNLYEDGVKFKALVVGTGSYEEEMSKLPNTQCLGFLSGDALSEVYASADIFLFPSEVETFGNVTLEALASGVPCIASAGCSGHLVIEKKNGFVCKKAGIKEYYPLTKRLVIDALLRRKLADQARPSILHLENHKVMDTMLMNYSTVIQDSKEFPRRSNRDDLFVFFIYFIFYSLLTIATPVIQAYVFVMKLMFRTWSKIMKKD